MDPRAFRQRHQSVVFTRPELWSETHVRSKGILRRRTKVRGLVQGYP
ncbi:hypothetical protein HMPREF0972_01382 [Actinomyces sp. oral taxon 848 str. F0332]|nr:hypothetical protein HMPREF0972_01382 [Actinomyces sp. oral taxon 848 str. F0332]